jgi:hypothetical protein
MSGELHAYIKCVADLQETMDCAKEAAAMAPLTLQHFRYAEHA